MDLGILFFSGAVVFQIITLPVEFDASKRALAELTSSGSLAPRRWPARKGAGRRGADVRGGGGHGGPAAPASRAHRNSGTRLG